MSSRSRSVRTAQALVASLIALGGVATAAPAHAVVNTCGGALADYSGSGVLADTAFTGTVTLPGGGTRDITITPLAPNSTLVRTEITASATDSRYALGDFILRVDSSGQGAITFPTYAGGAGTSKTVICATGTRVTKIAGEVHVQGVQGTLDFTASR
ncbi:hypothetical protein [Streptomyces sp. PvR034]|uniref:hypothetical protein n=1 Tax=Streptomyces sp. PvR034 TaxID=3156401 RepID=UPI0033924748